MKKILMGSFLLGALGVSINVAGANPVSMPVLAPVHPAVVSPKVIPSTVQTQVVNSYRALRKFWLSRAIMR